MNGPMILLVGFRFVVESITNRWVASEGQRKEMMPKIQAFF